MSKLRERLGQDLQIRNYSPETIKCYVRHVATFAKHFGTPPDRLGPEQVHEYQVFLATDKKVAWSTFNQTVWALRFFYQTTLGRQWMGRHVPYPRKSRRLPSVLSRSEVHRRQNPRKPRCSDKLKIGLLYYKRLRTKLTNMG